MLYHFITGHIRSKELAKDHFLKVLRSNTILSLNKRNGDYLGMFTREDTAEDKNYIHFTGYRNHLFDGIKHIEENTPRNTTFLIDKSIYGFVIDPKYLRNKKGVIYRREDITCMENLTKKICLSEHFTTQPITEYCQVLVYEEIYIPNYVTAYIVDNEVIPVGDFNAQSPFYS